MRRENAIHTQTRSVCVYVSQSKRENHPFPQEGGWEIEWPYIHKGENHPVARGGGGAGFSFLPGPHGGGEGMPQEAEHKTTKPRRWGRACRYPVPQGKTAGGISCSTGGGRIHHDVHDLLKYKST